MTTKELRTMNRLSQREFANILGITQQAVQKWERQDVKISVEVQQRIQELYHIGRINGRITSQDIGGILRIPIKQ